MKRNHCSIFALVLSGIFLLLRWQQVRLLQAQQEAAEGRVSHSQIIEQMKPLAFQIWPEYDFLNVSAESSLYCERTGSQRQTNRVEIPVWVVHFALADGHGVGSLYCNADTGELINLLTAHQAPRKAPTLEREALCHLAKEWLQKMNLNQQDERWQLSRVETDRNQVLFYWKSQSRRTIMVLGPSTGKLYRLSVSRIEPDRIR